MQLAFITTWDRTNLKVSFEVFEVPADPAPKPKRTYASAMGLRKPR